MKNLIRLSDYTKNEILEIFKIADDIPTGKYKNFLSQKTVIMFFPTSSIRTRVTFEKGINLLGGKIVSFSSETLDKKEEIKDVVGYLNNWVDLFIVRHKNIDVIDKISKYANVPIINAMTNVNHPCEIISDMYALSKIRANFLQDNYLFCGTNGNIGKSWKEIADIMNLSFTQCCPQGYEMNGVNIENNIFTAIRGKDVVCIDSIPKENLKDFRNFQITTNIMDNANVGAILNLCPPFYRGEELSDEVVESPYFVGYNFKKCLVEIQQAIIIYNMTYGEE